MYLENKTEIFYSKNIEIQFRKMYTHFKKGMVKNMKNWKKIMAGLCAAAMVSSMVVPVWAAEETTEEAADDGDVADVSEAMLGLWKAICRLLFINGMKNLGVGYNQFRRAGQSLQGGSYLVCCTTHHQAFLVQ